MVRKKENVMSQAVEINPAELQNPMQRAIAQASRADTFADIVIKACGDEYLPVSALIHKPEIRKLGIDDANKLSIKLSDAYTRGKLGRVDYHVGTTRYAYGKPNTEQAQMSQRAPRNVAPRNPVISAHRPVRMVFEFPDSDEALQFVMQYSHVLKYLKSE